MVRWFWVDMKGGFRMIGDAVVKLAQSWAASSSIVNLMLYTSNIAVARNINSNEWCFMCIIWLFVFSLKY